MNLKWNFRVGLALVLVGGWQVVRAHLRSDGALQAELHAAQDRYAALEEMGRHIDTVYHTDTLRFDAFRGKYAALRDSVMRSDGRVDTLFVPTLVQAADSTIAACTAVISTCEDKQANLWSQIGNLRTQLKLEQKRRPGFFAQLGQKVIWAGIGFGAAKVLSR